MERSLRAIGAYDFTSKGDRVLVAHPSSTSTAPRFTAVINWDRGLK
jgi:hypothetical protein